MKKLLIILLLFITICISDEYSLLDKYTLLSEKRLSLHNFAYVKSYKFFDEATIYFSSCGSIRKTFFIDDVRKDTASVRMNLMREESLKLYLENIRLPNEPFSLRIMHRIIDDYRSLYGYSVQRQRILRDSNGDFTITLVLGTYCAESPSDTRYDVSFTLSEKLSIKSFLAKRTAVPKFTYGEANGFPAFDYMLDTMSVPLDKR